MNKSLSTQELAFKYIFTKGSRIAHTYNYILGIFPWKLKWDGEMIANRLLEVGIIEERQVKRGIHGQIFQVYFRTLPSQEDVEIACLGLEGIEFVDKKVKMGVYKL